MGNTVGSLSEVQRAIVIGSLLGDGSMRCKANALLEINHSAHQRSHVDWKFGHLAELVSTPPKERRGNGGRIAYRFVTRSDPALTPYYRLFYADGHKRAPKLELRSCLRCGSWTMVLDRGTRCIWTQQFDKTSQEVMLGLLWQQWGLKATLNRDKSYYRIRISVEATKRLARLINPYLLPELRYKLPQVTP
jgi:hypothetical protein